MGLSRELMQKLMQGYRLPAGPAAQDERHPVMTTIAGAVDSSNDSQNQNVKPDARSDRNERKDGASALTVNPEHQNLPVSEIITGKAELKWLSPDEIEPHPFQPRTQEEQSMVEELRESIASCGQIVPAVVRRMETGSKCPYRLIEGHRRWEAVRQLNRSLLCYVVECTPHEEAIFLLAANLNRQELRYIPLSYAMRQIVELGVPQKELSAAIGWDPAAVSRCLRLSRLPSTTLNWLNQQQWSYRKINLAVESCLRHGATIDHLLPENLEQSLKQIQAEQEGKFRNRFRLSIQLPQRERETDKEDYERKALKVYYAGCAAGARELWKTVAAEDSLPAENELESVLYPAVEVLREMESAKDWTPEMVQEMFMKCWKASENSRAESVEGLAATSAGEA